MSLNILRFSLKRSCRYSALVRGYGRESSQVAFVADALRMNKTFRDEGTLLYWQVKASVRQILKQDTTRDAGKNLALECLSIQ